MVSVALVLLWLALKHRHYMSGLDDDTGHAPVMFEVLLRPSTGGQKAWKNLQVSFVLALTKRGKITNTPQPLSLSFTRLADPMSAKGASPRISLSQSYSSRAQKDAIAAERCIGHPRVAVDVIVQMPSLPDSSDRIPNVMLGYWNA